MKTLILLLLLIIYSCDDNNSIRTYSIPKKKIAPKETNQVSNVSNLFNWVAPSHWQAGKTSSMRLASFNVPYTEGVGDLSIANFSGEAGGVLANVNRWRGQLNLSSLTVDQLKNEMRVEQSSLGEFKMFKILNSTDESSAFLCSIFEIGHSTVFVKLVASISGINQLEKEFKEFCSSFFINEK